MARTLKLKQLSPVRVDEEFAAEVVAYVEKSNMDQSELQRLALREYMDNHKLTENQND